MPATRRNSSTVPSPRKSRASRREEQPIVDTETSRGTRRQASVSPKNTDTSEEKNIDNSQDVETRADGTAGGSSSPTTNDGVSRRSGRQRIVSKRLQDMELNFGTRKTPIKREHDGKILEDSWTNSLFFHGCYVLNFTGHRYHGITVKYVCICWLSKE